MPAHETPIVTPPTPVKRSRLASLGRYRKTFAAFVGAVLTWATAALTPDTHVSAAEWIALAVAVATALGVYGIKNEPLEVDAEAGYGLVEILVLVVLIALAVVGLLALIGNN